MCSLAELDKLLPKCAAPKDMDTDSNSSVGVTAAMEGLSTADMAAATSGVAEEESGEPAAGEVGGATSSNKKSASQLAAQAKLIQPIINVTSRSVPEISVCLLLFKVGKLQSGVCCVCFYVVWMLFYIFAACRLSASLSELFQNVLVKLSVGSVMLRQRRSHQAQNHPPVPSAHSRTIAKGLCKITMSGFKWTPPSETDISRLRYYHY